MSGCRASIQLPYFNLATGEAQFWFTCRGCRIALQAHFDRGLYDENFDFEDENDDWYYGDELEYYRIYSWDGFLGHIRDCKEAKRLCIAPREAQSRFLSRHAIRLRMKNGGVTTICSRPKLQNCMWIILLFTTQYSYLTHTLHITPISQNNLLNSSWPLIRLLGSSPPKNSLSAFRFPTPTR